MKDYLSGDALARFLQISKRKMFYFLQNGYIPMYDTGKKTHRYQVKIEDAEKFKKTLQNNPESFAHLKGLFSSRGTYERKVIIEPTKENSEAFAKFLSKQWKEFPMALPARKAAQLIGFDSRRICDMCNSGKIQAVMVGKKMICTKQSFIAFCSSEGMMANPNVTREYLALITAFVNIKMKRTQSK